MTQDPKHIGVPNICFSLTDANDKREEMFAEQRIKNGFDESETWSLTDTMANFTIPRLELFMKAIGPDDERTEDCQKLLIALKLSARNNGDRMYSKEEEIQIVDGLAVFPELFMRLWW